MLRLGDDGTSVFSSVTCLPPFSAFVGLHLLGLTGFAACRDGIRTVDDYHSQEAYSLSFRSDRGAVGGHALKLELDPLQKVVACILFFIPKILL